VAAFKIKDGKYFYIISIQKRRNGNGNGTLLFLLVLTLMAAKATPILLHASVHLEESNNRKKKKKKSSMHYEQFCAHFFACVIENFYKNMKQQR
jgi:hypothetical protein